MDYIHPEPMEIPIECDCFTEPFTIRKKVMVVENEIKPPRYAGMVSLAMIMGITRLYPPIEYSDTGIHLPKSRKEHKPHSGSKEQERRLKQLSKLAGNNINI